MTLMNLFGALNASPASRCDTCANARVIKGYAAKERVVLCAIASPPLPIKFAVYECSSYIVNAAPLAPRRWASCVPKSFCASRRRPADRKVSHLHTITKGEEMDD